ncbi:TRAP transporter small permease [Actibacterium lipolyticum]|uniref:TRAP transporter small permease protein n=1 Tax=Actibacterium lipolyticum TaxID=1524263 RepID=A0A238JME7_9RHOB|nr:TRAP transporter small permease [Actibacterium lipolyticum]SMX31072.1 Tripartite ATP-independent periplasmic transporters, DctQ component [Actibacterium lipolyticum]
MRNWSERASARINTAVEAIVAMLMAALVLDVWLGVADRYYFHWQLPWPEVLARYLMIWAALLAVSSGVARRDHIGLTAFIMVLPYQMRRAVLILIDILALALFIYVAWFGIAFAQSGAPRQAMIFGASLAPFYAAVPVAATLSAVQLVLVLLRDMGGHVDQPPFNDHMAEKIS